MKSLRVMFLCAAAVVPALAQTEPCAGLPGGKHALLERFTAEFELTCAQQLQVEPLLHAEEAVSKPLLAFVAFTPEEQQAVMLKIKLAARRQVRGLLTAEQQKKMDGEIDTTAKGGKGGKKGAPKKEAPKVDGFVNEEALSSAVMNYAALMPDEKKAMTLDIKRAARRGDALQLSAEQQKKIDADIQQLSK